MRHDSSKDPVVQIWNALIDGGEDDGIIEYVIRLAFTLILFPFVLIYGVIRDFLGVIRDFLEER